MVDKTTDRFGNNGGGGGGGQTAWKSSAKFIPVAPGGELKVTVEVTNVADLRYPSAVLVNDISVK